MQARAKRPSRARRCAASGIVALALTAVGSVARADDAQQFELLKGLFYAGQYEEVLQRIAILLETSNPACATVEGAPTVPQTCHLADGVLIERMHEMHIVALYALKRQEEADAIIERMLKQNPTYSPEPGSLPAAVAERVAEIKARLQKELEDAARKKADEQRRAAIVAQKQAEDERKWIAELTALAATETFVERRSRFVAFLPFGVGQIQNGDTTLGLALMGTQAAAAASAVVFGTIHAFYAAADLSSRDPKGNPVDRRALAEQTRIVAAGNQIAFSTWAALAVGGIIHANVTFVSEVRTTRERPIPKRPLPAVMPSVAVSGDGAHVGIVGSF